MTRQALPPLPLLAALIMLAAACGEPEEDDTSAALADADTSEIQEEDEGTKEACEEVSIKVIGEEPPTVDSTWTVYMSCDGAVMTGATVVRIDPPDFASIADNVITWTTAGEAVLSVQIGSVRLTEDVVVSEGR